MPVNGILEETSKFREALRKTFPHQFDQEPESYDPSKSYACLIEGTLIGASRYGEHIATLSEGKLNFVDGDIDVLFVVPEKEQQKVLEEFGSHLSGWTHMGDRGDGIHVFTSTLRLPTSCDQAARGVNHFYVDIHFAMPKKGGDDGSVGLQTVPAGVFKSNVGADGLMDPSMLFPMQKVHWGKGEGYFAPKEYTRLLQTWNGGEYTSTPWLPQSHHMATGDWFACNCNVDEDDLKNLRSVGRHLQTSGLANFHDKLIPQQIKHPLV